MSFAVIEADHFDGDHNLTQGQRHGSDEILSEILGKFRSGSRSFTGAGTEAVVFNTPFADANYTITFGPDTAGMDPIWSSKTATGFSITNALAGAGNVDWMAVHD